MSLLCKPTTPDEDGCIHDVAPSSSGLAYVGFSVHRLRVGQSLSRKTGDREACIVLLSGQAKASAGGRDFGEIGKRGSIFEGTPPFAIYAPPGSDWSITALTGIEIGVGTAPAKGVYPPSLITPDDIETVTRGTGTNLRRVNPIMMDDRDAAESLLITEVFTPAGHWSSYPPHKHDVDDFPNETLLEETYYHRIAPPQGFAFQRIYTDDRSLDETMCIHDGDVVKVPRGYHPCAAAHGYDLYYLNVMAGPLRQWRFRNEPDHDWIANSQAG